MSKSPRTTPTKPCHPETPPQMLAKQTCCQLKNIRMKSRIAAPVITFVAVLRRERSMRVPLRSIRPGMAFVDSNLNGGSDCVQLSERPEVHAELIEPTEVLAEPALE